MTGYQYAANNPVLFNDPLGDRWLQSDDEALIFGRDIDGGRHNAQIAGIVDHIVGEANAIMESHYQQALQQMAASSLTTPPIPGAIRFTDPEQIRALWGGGEVFIKNNGHWTLSYNNAYTDFDGTTISGGSGIIAAGDQNGEYKINGGKAGSGTVGQPGAIESIAPIWGPGRSAIDHFQRGNYWRGAAYTALAVSDVFLVKSIGTAIGKGAWKLGAHSWGATRSWMLKRGYVKSGEPLHHWAITQAAAKKYGLQNVANQPWNLVRFSSHSMHIRAGHRMNYLGQPGYTMFGQFLYATPTWFKAAIVSGSGRVGL